MFKMQFKFEYTRMSKESVAYCSQFISVKVKNFRLRHNDGFLIKKHVECVDFVVICFGEEY